jgi:hypothetical protein
VIGLMETLQPRTVEVKGATVVHKLDVQPKKHMTFEQICLMEQDRLSLRDRRAEQRGTPDKRKRIIAALCKFRDAQLEWVSVWSIAKETGLIVPVASNILTGMHRDGIVRHNGKRTRIYGNPEKDNAFGYGWMLNEN